MNPAEHETAALLEISDVWKKRGQNQVLRGITLSARKGEVLCLMGPSGAGKSTLLRCINAIELYDRGRIRVAAELIGIEEAGGKVFRLPESRVSRQRQRIGMVFQGFNLFPHQTVLENISGAPIRVKGTPRPKAENAARQLLDRVGLADKATAYPRQLSGGQQQRVAIARALAMQPELMLFDEPTSALDPHLTWEVLDVMKALAAQGTSMVVVTHELDFALEVADRVAVMIDGEIAEIGPPQKVLADPDDPRVRQFALRTQIAKDTQ